MKKVAIVMGSDSDLPIAEKAAQQLKDLGIPFEVHVMSAHRTPDEACAFAKSAKENGFGVLISIAGLDALLATVQMPSGIPVATVAVNGSKNAAILAAQMLALSDAALDEKLVAMRKTMADEVRAKDRKIAAQFSE